MNILQFSSLWPNLREPPIIFLQLPCLLSQGVINTCSPTSQYSHHQNQLKTFFKLFLLITLDRVKTQSTSIIKLHYRRSDISNVDWTVLPFLGPKYFNRHWTSLNLEFVSYLLTSDNKYYNHFCTRNISVCHIYRFSDQFPSGREESLSRKSFNVWNTLKHKLNKSISIWMWYPWSKRF